MNLRPNYFSWAGPLFRGLGWILGVGVFLAFIIGLVWHSQSGCEGDHARAERVLESAGYKGIQIGGAHARWCGEGDSESNEFTALGPTGKYAEGVVCCSREGCGGKGCTVRLQP